MDCRVTPGNDGGDCGNLCGEIHQPCTSLLEGVAQPAALAVAKPRELCQGVAKQRMRRRDQGSRVARVVTHDPRPAQHIHDVDPGRGA